MWGSGSDETERLFRKQFEEENGRILFRRNQRDKPVVVRPEEVEESVTTFLSRQKIVTRVGVAAIMIAIVILVVVDDGKWIDRDGSIWLLITAWIVPFMLAWFWAWSSPTERFRHRLPTGNERTRAELRLEMLEEWSWWKILWPSGLGLLLTLPRIAYWPPASIDDWIWFSMGAFLVVAGSLQAIRKWRLIRD